MAEDPTHHQNVLLEGNMDLLRGCKHIQVHNSITLRVKVKAI